MRFRLSSLFVLTAAIALVVGGVTAGWRWGTTNPPPSFDGRIYPWLGAFVGFVFSLTAMGAIVFSYEALLLSLRLRKLRQARSAKAKQLTNHSP
jgi:hypothetical protein